MSGWLETCCEGLVVSQSPREGFLGLKERQYIFPSLEPVSDPGL